MYKAQRVPVAKLRLFTQDCISQGGWFVVSVRFCLTLPVVVVLSFPVGGQFLIAFRIARIGSSRERIRSPHTKDHSQLEARHSLRALTAAGSTQLSCHRTPHCRPHNTSPSSVCQQPHSLLLHEDRLAGRASQGSNFTALAH